MTVIDSLTGNPVQFIFGMIAVFIVLMIIFYIYVAIAVMTIAKKLNNPHPWMAWIPFANAYLLTELANVPWWTLLIAIVAGFIPFIGIVISMGIMTWWWWNISKARGKPAWFGLLTIIPIVNLVIMGVIAWSD